MLQIMKNEKDSPVIVASAEGTNELVGDVEWDGCAENDGGMEVEGALLIDGPDDTCKLGGKDTDGW